MSYVAWLRERVGHRKVYLPYVTVIARDNHGRVLLQRRTDFEFWGLPGGVLELDEDVQTGARRELAEETGLGVGTLRLVGIYTDPRYDVLYPNGDAVQQFTICVEGRVHGGVMRADGLETWDQEFVSPAALAAYDLPLWYRDMLREAAQGGPPAFRPPYSAVPTADQIAQVRPFLGHDLVAGVGATAVIGDANGRILLLQHQGEEGWRLPSGFAELGENAAQTAVREVWEETGLDIEPVRLLGVHASPVLDTLYANGDRVHNVGAVFQARILGGELLLDSREIAAMAWLEPREIPDRITVERRPLYEHILGCLDEGSFLY